MSTSDGFEVPFALGAPTIARMMSAMEVQWKCNGRLEFVD
jgi:hypothetical protein